MVPYPKMSSKGRTELQISLSGAKNVKEAAGDVRFGAAPPKSAENDEKPKKISEKNFEKKLTKVLCFGMFVRFLRKHAKTDVTSSFLDIFCSR